MAQLPTNIDCTQELTPVSRDPLPAGDYTAQIIEEAIKPTKRGDGEYLELKLEVLTGPHTGRWIFDRLNIRNPNKVAVEISERQLVALGKACGLQTLTDSSQLRGIPVVVTVKVKTSEAYGASNEVVGYKAATASSTASTSAPKPPWADEEPPF